MFREMSNVTYYVSTLLLYGVEILGAIVIKDVGPIFEFIAAFAISAI